MTTWLDALQGDLTPYRCLPFWSWNDRLEKAELIRQIRWMKQAGMGGFFMHARSGLRTAYMSEDWFEAVETAAQEAQRQQMAAWCYDENGWPSGFAGMKLLEDPDNWAHFLTYETRETFDPEALAVYLLEDGRLRRIVEPSAGSSLVYHTLYDHTNSSVVDVLNPRIVRQFLDETHERYLARFPAYAGTLLQGFFTDEPQYYRWDTAYTPLMLDLYRDAYGEELLDTLGALFVDCVQSYPTRFRYWRLMNQQFCSSFGRQIYDWCSDHGCRLTGHAVEEQRLSTQMWCCAGVMPFYAYEHIPGCDWLGREIGTEITPRQVSSVAQQLGKKQTLTESFACTGWDVTPSELKRLVEWQYVHGINLLSVHLSPYSIAGPRKNDYPAFFSDCLPWSEQFPVLFDYIARLGLLLTESEEVVHVGVLHPMHAAYLDYQRGSDYASIRPLEDAFAALVEELGAAHIGHHYIDETLLETYGSVEGATLVVGRCRYDALVIPAMKGIDASTARLLQEYVQNGGRVYLTGNPPQYIDGQKADLSFLTSNCTWEELIDPAFSISDPHTAIRSTFRRSPRGDVVFAVNLSKTQTHSVVYHIQTSDAARLDLETVSLQPLPYRSTEEGIVCPLILAPGESAVILCGQGFASALDSHTPELEAVPDGESSRSIVWTDLTADVTAADENTLVLDYVRLSLDGQTYSEPMPVGCASHQLLAAQQNRTVYLSYTFTVEEMPRSLFLETEYTGAASIDVNGRTIDLSEPGTLHRACRRGDLLPYIRLGENTIRLKLLYTQPSHVYDVLFHTPDVTESLINCLVYDTTIEAIYLRGDFGVFAPGGFQPAERRASLANGPFVLRSRPKRVTLAHLEQQGYLFFAGSLTLRVPLPARSVGPGTLRLKGRYAIARASLDGEDPQTLVFQDSFHVEQPLHPEGTCLTVTLTSGNRNLFGPFHLKGNPEPAAVAPIHFDMGRTWQNGTSPLYTDTYAFLSFGLDAVEWEREGPC